MKTFFETAQSKPQGRRYSREWIYQCIMMKIKGQKLYKLIRDRGILPLPYEDTIRNYIKRAVLMDFESQPSVL